MKVDVLQSTLLNTIIINILNQTLEIFNILDSTVPPS